MSQLFDSLRRGRGSQKREAAPRRTAHGDAVLATLGYAPARRRGAQRLVMALAVAGIAVLLWAGWQARSPTEPAAGEAVGRPPLSPAPEVPASVPIPTPPAPEGAALDGGAREDETPARPPVSAAISSPPPRGVGAAEPRPIPDPSQARRPDATDARTPADAPPADLMAIALYHHRAGDFENALVAYRTLIEQNELNAAAHNNLGLLYQQKNLLDDAARAFQRALIINPRYGLARNNYGVTLLRQGRHDAAAAQFRAVLQLDARNTDAVVNLALAEQSAGQPEQATASLLRALGMAPGHALAHYNLAVLHDETGEAALALEHYRAFLEHAGADHAERALEVRARLEALGRR